MPHDELTYSNITYGVCIYGVWTSTWCFHIKQLHHCRFLHKRDDLLVAALAAKNIGFIPSQVPLWTAEAPLQPFCSQSARRRLLPTSSSPTSQEDWNGCGPPELPKELFALLLAVSVCAFTSFSQGPLPVALGLADFQHFIKYNKCISDVCT
jgi:hypothetical protein